MKTNMIFRTLLSLSLVIFMASSGISNSVVKSDGNDLGKNGNKIVSANKSDSETVASGEMVNEFNYLRFDVNDYSSESTIEELPVIAIDYLRFDANDFLLTSGSEITELPVANEFDYLRFDVDNFTENSSEEMPELTANELDYLRFDVTKYSVSESNFVAELPLTE